MISIREGRRSRVSIWRPSRLFDFVGPFVHTEFAIEEEPLALLNELAEILGGSTPYLEVDKSGDLLFLPLSVGEVLARCWRWMPTEQLSRSGCIGVRDQR
jgi:hypothetical protein